jgi:hypothetical protein
MQLEVSLATPADDEAIRELLRRQPMPGRIRLTYEREPDFRLGCEVTGDDCQVLVARPENRTEIVGIACRSVRQVFINGVAQRIGYLGQLRVDSRFRGRWLVSRGFSRLKQMHDRDPLPGYLASIVGGNDEATGVLVRKRRRAFPAFRPVADFRTLAIHVHRAKPALRSDLEISAARMDELAEIASFLQINGAGRQFSPIWTQEAILGLYSFGLETGDLTLARRHGRIVGITGLWDQSHYKQTVIHGYSGWLKGIAPLYNLAAPWLGRVPLPSPGEKLKSVYASLICIANDEVAVFRSLLREIYNVAAARGFRHLLVGLDENDPLLAAARDYSHVIYPSQIYLAEWTEGGGLYEQLDGRPAYVEIATL